MFKGIFRHLLLVLLLCEIAPSNALSKEFGGLNYPELLVTPRASTRLKLEAIKEKHRKWQTHLSTQASGLMTLVGGIMQLGNTDTVKDPDKKAAYAAIVIGGGWLGLTTAMAQFYTPYQSGYGDIARLKRGSPREQLLRERLAESHITQAAKMGRRLTWFSTISNAAASFYLLSNQEKDTISGPINFLALIAAFTPLMVPYLWERVDDEQKMYKKRIYGPLVMATMLPYQKRVGIKETEIGPAPGILFKATF